MEINVGDNVCVKAGGLWGPIFVAARVTAIIPDVEWIDSETKKSEVNIAIEVEATQEATVSPSTTYRCHPSDISKIR